MANLDGKILEDMIKKIIVETEKNSKLGISNSDIARDIIKIIEQGVKL